MRKSTPRLLAASSLALSTPGMLRMTILVTLGPSIALNSGSVLVSMVRTRGGRGLGPPSVSEVAAVGSFAAGSLSAFDGAAGAGATGAGIDTLGTKTSEVAGSDGVDGAVGVFGVF